MTDPLRLLQAGDRLNGIPAAAWNAFVNAAKYVQQLQATGAAPALGSLTGPGQVLVLNNSGADRDQYTVLQIDEALIAPADNQPGFASRVALSCVTPTANRKGSFVVLSRPIPAGEVGTAWIDGVCPARISGGGSWADTKNGETAYLEAGDYGNARIIADPTGGTSERWAYVRLNDRRGFILVKTVAGPDATPYPPEEDNPNVYRCQILSGSSFTKSAGSQVLSYTATGRYDYVMNLVDDHYIEEESVLGALELDGQIYTMDKVRQQEIVVVGHTLRDTGKGTGSLSRVNQNTGAAIWTVDLGAETLGPDSYPRIVYAVDLDSRGNVYAYWRPSNTTDGRGIPNAFNTFKQGIKKYNSNGELLQSFDFPNVALMFNPITDFQFVALKVSPLSDDVIYCGVEVDTDGHCLYQLDGKLAPQWGYTLDNLGTPIGRCTALAVRPDGTINAALPGGPYHIAADGSDILTPVGFGTLLGSLGIVPGSGNINVGLFAENDSAPFAAGFDPLDFSPALWGRTHEFFPTPEVLGEFQASANVAGTSCFATDLYFVVASAEQVAYDRAGSAGTAFASYLVMDQNGNPLHSGCFGGASQITGLPIYRMAFNPTTARAFVVSLSSRTVGEIDYVNNLTKWHNQLCASTPDAADRGWCIAARTCRG